MYHDEKNLKWQATVQLYKNNYVRTSPYLLFIIILYDTLNIRSVYLRNVIAFENDDGLKKTPDANIRTVDIAYFSISLY